MEIIECQTREAILVNFDLLASLYPLETHPHFSREFFERCMPDLEKEGYRQIIAVEQGQTIGVAGFNLLTRLYKGKVLRINDLVVEPAHRGQGVGTAILGWLEEEARRKGAVSVVLDSGVPRVHSHKFYQAEGFTQHALHFIKAV